MVEVKTDLRIESIQLELHMQAINRIDRELINHTREALHRWIITGRDGFIYKRKGEIVGYGHVGSSSGPFAVLDENDFPAVLAHAEKSFRSEEHTSELQSQSNLVCRLLL